MSRSRNIKPGFFKNEALAELPFEYRILFQGLWCEADREGRLEDRPKRLKAELFPYDPVDVNAGLDALAKAGFIARYEVTGQRFIEVLNFAKHQNPHKKETPSAIPAWDRTVQDREIPEQAPEIPERAGLIPDSPSLIPDSPKKPLARQAARFSEFWDAYPVKKGRKEAEAKWKARNLDAIADHIIEDVRNRMAKDRQWLAGYVPHGSTYVNGAGWEDAIEAPRSAPSAEPVRKHKEL